MESEERKMDSERGGGEREREIEGKKKYRDSEEALFKTPNFKISK